MMKTPNEHRETKKSYSELLDEPEWRGFRDHIIHQRKACESCGSRKHLQVHHRGYVRGKRPAQYDDSQVALYCRNCHEEITEHADKIWNMALSLDPIFSRLAVKLFEAITAGMESKPVALIDALRAATTCVEREAASKQKPELQKQKIRDQLATLQGSAA